MKLFFDTETSGKATFNLSPAHPSQPHLVQLGAILTTDNCEEISHVNLLAKPSGWTISPDAQRVHGISQDFAVNHGIPIISIMSIFTHLSHAATTLHAFNYQFDRIVCSAELMRLSKPDVCEVKPGVCEMLAMTPICKLPPKFPGSLYKWPSLTEAYQHCFGETFDGAHDALADVRAMVRIHHWRMNSQAPKPTPA